MIIKNYEHLATSTSRKQILRILEAGLEAINTENLMRQNFAYNKQEDALYINSKKFDISKFKKVVVVGAGKMVARAAEGIEEAMLDRLAGGMIIDIVPGNLKKIVSRVGTHPLPSGANVTATNEIITMLNNLTEQDLVIAIIGGGGSSLMTSPQVISVDEERMITKALMDSGADILETNTVRKHFSQIKGGGLAKLAYPASVISLIFSDVPGDDISMVASGPTVRDNTTIQDAMEIMNKHNILQKCSMQKCGFIETPKDKKYFEHVENILFCSNKMALDAMEEKAKDLGLRAKIWNSSFTGEARDLAQKIISEVKPNQCLIAGGESVVTMNSHDHGSGGRNQEMGLAALLKLQPGVVFAALASDGRDNSDVAGALVDETNLARANTLHLNLLDSLNRHDEYTALLDINAAIMTGVTGSNVSDLVVCIRE